MNLFFCIPHLTGWDFWAKTRTKIIALGKWIDSAISESRKHLSLNLHLMWTERAGLFLIAKVSPYRSRYFRVAAS